MDVSVAVPVAVIEEVGVTVSVAEGVTVALLVWVIVTV